MLKLNKLKYAVLASVCLHNFIKKEEKLLAREERFYCPTNFGDRIVNNELILGECRKEMTSHHALQSLTSVTEKESLSGIVIRNMFKNYFTGVGQVPWQWKKSFGWSQLKEILIIN